MEESKEKRFVTITRQSMFYVPEDGSPCKKRSSNVSRHLFQEGDYNEEEEEEAAGSAYKSPGALKIWPFLVMVALLGLIAYLLVSISRETLPVNLGFTGVGVALGVVLGHTCAVVLKADL